MIAAEAAAYHASGWHPIALRPNEKRPICQGWQTTPLADTLAAIEANPGANIGLAVPAGNMVLDVDIKNDGPATLAALETAYGVLPATLSATTATGGRHLWFALPSGVSVGNRVGIAPGLDVRSQGGYVVAPPSTINGKPYAWDSPPAAIAHAPDWLLDLASHPATPPPKLATDSEQAIPEGMRNRALFEAAAAMRGKGFPTGAIEAALTIMNAERCNPPLDDAEVATIAKSAGQYRPEAQPWEVFAGNAAAPKCLNLLTTEDLAALPPLAWAIRGVLPAEGLAAIYGPSGSGKSFLVLDMLLALANGRDWFGNRVKEARPVIYAALEGEAGIAGRVKAYQGRYGAPGENVRYLLEPVSLLNPFDVENMAAAILEAQCRNAVVVLDTLNRAAPGADENDSKSMGLIIAAAKALQAKVGGLVLLVHHSGKDATKGLRGHSSLHAALDALIEVRRDGDRREWLIAKSKDGEDGKAHPFRLNVVILGIDQEGEALTSCVVQPVADVNERLHRALPPKSANQRAAWEALSEIFRNTVAERPGGAPESLPEGKPCIRMEDAIEATRARLVCEPKRQTERTRDAIKGLVTRGLLQHEGGYLWLA